MDQARHRWPVAGAGRLREDCGVSELSKVRVEIGESYLFTRVFIDDKELPGITRIWFDSGDFNGNGPLKRMTNSTRIHVEFYPRELVVEGEGRTDLLEVHPMYSGSKR
jgi:hypothetical protein